LPSIRGLSFFYSEALLFKFKELGANPILRHNQNPIFGGNEFKRQWYPACILAFNKLSLLLPCSLSLSPAYLIWYYKALTENSRRF
jgi:hypothetical protein